MENHPVNILFVCVGNSCRSQMAEAWANHLGKGKVRAMSAGSHPLGRITAGTYDVMQEKGISLDEQCSKGLKDVPVNDMDFVISMGCEVECPVPKNFRGRYLEWKIPDPYGGGHEAFRSTRDLVERQVRALLNELNGDSRLEARNSKLDAS